MPRLTLAPLSRLKAESHQIPAHRFTPNTSIQHHPLLIYRSCFPPSTSASDIESHLRDVGVVEPQWRYTMYSQSHFHSTSHEVLVIFRGQALICLGGEDNPGRIETEVKEGDVIVMPAGVAHRLLDDHGSGFQMIGSYARGFNWDMCYGKAGEEKQVRNIAKLDWFKRDPIYDDLGPVLSQG